MGSRRDIPRNAVIHPTVHELHKAGVLSAEQMPKLGGEDSPRLLVPEAARKKIEPLVSVSVEDLGVENRMV